MTASDVANTWTLIASDGDMKVYKSEVEDTGAVVQHPLKAVHTVKVRVLFTKLCTNSSDYNFYLLICWNFGNRCYLPRNDPCLLLDALRWPICRRYQKVGCRYEEIGSSTCLVLFCFLIYWSILLPSLSLHLLLVHYLSHCHWCHMPTVDSIFSVSKPLFSFVSTVRYYLHLFAEHTHLSMSAFSGKHVGCVLTIIMIMPYRDGIQQSWPVQQ